MVLDANVDHDREAKEIRKSSPSPLFLSPSAHHQFRSSGHRPIQFRRNLTQIVTFSSVLVPPVALYVQQKYHRGAALPIFHRNHASIHCGEVYNDQHRRGVALVVRLGRFTTSQCGRKTVENDQDSLCSGCNAAHR